MRVEESALVDASAEAIFAYADWCNNNPRWLPFIEKASVLRKEGPGVLGEVSEYNGTMFGRRMHWQAVCVSHEPPVHFVRAATTGPPAKWAMKGELRCVPQGAGTSNVAFAFEYQAPYPLIGPLVDRLLRRRARAMARAAVEGLRSLAAKGAIPPVEDQVRRGEAVASGHR